MSRFDLGQRVATLANIGVIAGIVFLALELRQNDELFGIEQRAAALDRQVSMVDIVFRQAFEEVQEGVRDEGAAIRFMRHVYHRPVLNYGMPLAWEAYRERTTPEFIEWMEKNIIGGE